MWDEITNPFPDFNGCTIEVWEWKSNFFPHFIMSNYLSILWLELIHVSKTEFWWCEGHLQVTLGVVNGLPSGASVAWISNYIHYKVWDEIIYPFLNFNGATIDVWELISNFIPHFTGYICDYLPMLGLMLFRVGKEAQESRVCKWYPTMSACLCERKSLPRAIYLLRYLLFSWINAYISPC